MICALIVVDVQTDFFEGGSLPATETRSLISELGVFVERARATGVLVVFTQDWHPPDHLSFVSMGGPWPTHCVANSPGAALVPPLIAGKSDVVIRKGVSRGSPGYSAFEATGLDTILRDRSVESVAICGIATEYCVRATALDTLKAGIQTAVLYDLVRPVNLTATQRTMNELSAAGVDVVSGEEWLSIP